MCRDFHHNNWLTYSYGTDRQANSLKMILWLTFQLESLTVVNLTVPLFWIYFFWCLYLFHGSFPVIGKFWSCYYLSFQMGMSLFIAQLVAISVLIGMVIWEILHCRTSLNSVFLVLVLDFVSGSKLELMYISLIANICSSILCCCYGSYK